MTQKLEKINHNLKKQKKIYKNKNTDNILDFLKIFSISFDDLEDIYLQLYVPHPGVDTIEKAIEMFKKEFYDVMNDPNLCLLIYCGILLEKDVIEQKLPFIDKEDYNQDLSFIITDEILGETIAEYIAGYKGRFEFVRFDKLKPGKLSKLGPFIDDVISGIIGGISANIYSKCIYNEKK